MDICRDMNAEYIDMDLIETKIFTLSDKDKKYESSLLRRNENLIDILHKRGFEVHQTF